MRPDRLFALHVMAGRRMMGMTGTVAALRGTRSGIPFRFEMPVAVFEKAGGTPGTERRIGGIASTDKLDKQDEVVIQRGLDFQPFLRGGWFNDNHSRDTAHILGYPDPDRGARYVQKGDCLPDGTTAPRAGWWVEGYLLKGHEPADKIWNLAKALQESDRRLGFSIEGKVVQRWKSNPKVIVKAVVRNVAVTGCPINDDTRLEVLAKSMSVVEKALRAGQANEKPSTPGAGGGRPMRVQSLEGPLHVFAAKANRWNKRKRRGVVTGPNGVTPVLKSLSKGDAVSLILALRPDLPAGVAGRIVDAAFAERLAA